MKDDWNAHREQLEAALVKVALDLFGHTGSNAFKIPVPHTTPPLFIVCGEEQTFSVASHERDIESEEFCNRMQTYRHMKGPQADVVNAYEHVKEYINERLSAAPTELTRDLLERAVEAQRNDTRTPAEKIADGVKFVMGPGGDEGTRPDNPSTLERKTDHKELINKLWDRAKALPGEHRHVGGTAHLLLEAAEALSATSATALKGKP